MLTLSFQDVHFRYDSGRGVEGITFELHLGEVLGLLGPNGSGKSTIVRLTTGFLRPQKGFVSLFGQRPGRDRRALRRLGFSGDRPSHWERLTGWQEAWFFARQYGLPEVEARRRLEFSFDFWGLGDVKHEPVSGYSYGMRKRLALLEATVHSPDLLVLDEPTLGLDLEGRQLLEEVVKDQGVAVLVGTNDVDFAEEICDRVLLLHRGQIVTEGSPADLVAQLGGQVEIEVELRTAIPIDQLQSDGWCERVAATETGFKAILRRGARDLAAVIGATTALGGEVRNVRVSEPTLADVYLKCTGEVLE